MSERTALEIALDLDAASCSSFAKLEAAESLRQQHAEIERLKTVPMKYRRMAFNAQLQEENTQLSEKVERLTALNSALTAKGNAFVIENARQAEKIGRLTAEKFRRFNNEECWIYQRNGENHLGTLTCPVVISPDRMGDIVAQDGTTIAIVIPLYDGDEWAANSMLIAAAPDLLEVCRRLAEVNVFSVESEVASIIMDAVTVVRKVQEVGK